MSNQGGGASKTTEEALGSSGATDVSLREYVAVKFESLDRHLTHEIAALRRETEAAHMDAKRAIEVAADEAKERLSAHNNLIGQMRDQASHFATREIVEENKKGYNERFQRIESFQSKIIGGLAVVAVVGVANAVKVWTGG